MLELGCWVELVWSRSDTWVEDVGMVIGFPAIWKKRYRDILMCMSHCRAQNIVI